MPDAIHLRRTLDRIAQLSASRDIAEAEKLGSEMGLAWVRSMEQPCYLIHNWGFGSPDLPEDDVN